MIEVLVAIVVLSIGLLGLAGLQMKLQALEIDSYQRSQALILLDDMASRLSSNRQNASSYLTSSPIGPGECPTVTDASPRSDLDLRDWCLALKGSTEKKSNNAVGAMINALGCVISLGSGSNSYQIVVSWQGLGELPSDADSALCNDKDYGSTNRRAAVSVVTIGRL